MEPGDQSVSSIDQKKKAVKGVDVDNKNQTGNEKFNKPEEGFENRQKEADYKDAKGNEKEPTENCDNGDEKKRPNEQSKDNVQVKETRNESKKHEHEKKGTVNENKTKVPAAGNAKGPWKAKRKTVRMDDSFEETDRYATPRGVNI